MKYLRLFLILLLGLFIGVTVGKQALNSSIQSLLGLVVEQPKTKFYPESLGAKKKDTEKIEIRETAAFTRSEGNSYQLNILVDKASKLLPERIYLIDKETKTEIVNSPINLARFQSNVCREKTNPEHITLFETQFFKVNHDLRFSKTDPMLKQSFNIVVVYQDERGNRYFSMNEIKSVCSVMME